jgi:hypothetical protein
MLLCTVLTKNLKGYVLDEIMGFVTKYLQEFQHVSRKKWDAKEEEGVVGELLEGVAKKVVLNSTLQIAHNYVLKNIEIMAPWI